jgi:predicted dienelactone hydrolase
MKRILKSTTLALTALVALSSLNMNANAAGYKSTEITVAHRQVPLQAHIWYPSGSGGKTLVLGKNKVFKGVEVQAYSKVKEGKHPLVLLSHGSGGNAINLAWIAAYLADQGMIVAAINHPNTTSRNSIPKETVKVWERVDDLSSIIDFFEEDFVQNEFHPDLKNIATIGFSLGGYSALGIAGAKVKKAKYADYCKVLAQKSDCIWLVKGGVDFKAIDQMKFERDNRNERVKYAVAIDPALAQAYDMKSLTDLKTPVQIINLGVGKEIPSGINGSELAKYIPNAQYHEVKQATHFSFLGECTKLGEKIINAEGDDSICSETGNRARSDIHNELKGLIGSYLKSNLSIH